MPGGDATGARFDGFDTVILAFDDLCLGSFVDFGTQFAGVVEEDLVVLGAVNLPCGELSILLVLRRAGLIAKLRERQKLKVPGYGVRTPEVGA